MVAKSIQSVSSFGHQHNGKRAAAQFQQHCLGRLAGVSLGISLRPQAEGRKRTATGRQVRVLAKV